MIMGKSVNHWNFHELRRCGAWRIGCCICSIWLWDLRLLSKASGADPCIGLIKLCANSRRWRPRLGAGPLCPGICFSCRSICWKSVVEALLYLATVFFVENDWHWMREGF